MERGEVGRLNIQHISTQVAAALVGAAAYGEYSAVCWRRLEIHL
jgi:hypothetical protein